MTWPHGSTISLIQAAQIADLLGDPHFPESDFVNETPKNIRKHGIDLADNVPQKYASCYPAVCRSGLLLAAETWHETGRWGGGAGGWP